MAVGHKHWGAVIFVCCFQCPQQEGCRWWCGDTKKNPTQKYKFLSFTGFMWLTHTCLKCWNITFNKDNIHERACLQNPCLPIRIPFSVVFKVLQAFLTFVPSESYSCTPNLHLKASSPLRAILRNGNLSPHPEVWFLNGVQADDFSWMGVF